MYSEDYENRGFPFRDFFLKLILIIIFVFLLVWLLPKFITPKIVENSKTNTEISALTSQIFTDNLNRMKEAAILYYTSERLPKNVGDTDTMTLSDMIGKKLITPLIDKNNKACDVEKSYVRIAKTDNEYILKVNLKDSEKEDYILVHLGCYSYCDSYICEKKEPTITTKPIPSKPTPTPSQIPEPTPTPTPTDDPKPKPTPEPSYIYEYKKTVGIEFSAWTKWSAWAKTDCATKAITCSDSSADCLMQLKLYSRKENIGTYDKEYVTTTAEVVRLSSYTQTTCSNYHYVIVNNITYATTTSFDNGSSISSSSTSVEGWRKTSSHVRFENPPRSTATTRYIWVGSDYSYCNETCETLPASYYDVWTYTGSMDQVSSTTSTVTAQCGSYVTKEVPVYGTIQKSHISTRKEPLYGTVCYQSTKTRKITDAGKTQYRWSHYNDVNLLNDGWTYTGAKKLAN